MQKNISSYVFTTHDYSSTDWRILITYDLSEPKYPHKHTAHKVRSGCPFQSIQWDSQNRGKLIKDRTVLKLFSAQKEDRGGSVYKNIFWKSKLYSTIFLKSSKKSNGKDNTWQTQTKLLGDGLSSVKSFHLFYIICKRVFCANDNIVQNVCDGNCGRGYQGL